MNKNERKPLEWQEYQVKVFQLNPDLKIVLFQLISKEANEELTKARKILESMNN